MCLQREIFPGAAGIEWEGAARTVCRHCQFREHFKPIGKYGLVNPCFACFPVAGAEFYQPEADLIVWGPM